MAKAGTRLSRLRHIMKFIKKAARPSLYIKEAPLYGRFTFGDPVVVYFGTAGIIQNCTVIKIHFTESKTFYDVEVKWKHIDSADNARAGVDKERELTGRIHNIEEALVFSPKEFEQPHPEDNCQQCGGPNPVWSAENDLWNEVSGSPNGIICPVCFEKKAAEKGINVILRMQKV